MLERTPESERGGNSRFTAGGMRFAYDGPDDIIELIPDLTEQEKATTDFGSYPESEFFSDLARITNYRADPDLAHLLVTKSREAVFWLRDHAGVRFLPSYRRFAFLHNGRHTFWGGVTVESSGGGPGLVEAETNTYLNAGGRAAYEARAVELLYDGRAGQGCPRAERRRLPRRGGRVGGARRRGIPGKSGLADAVSGPGYDLARVRGTWANTGDGIRMALDIGAVAFGQWSGAHAVPWDLNAPEFGDLRVGDGFSKLSYPLGVMVNVNGDRFVDEGADFRTYTYAKYGHDVIRQPGQAAWQIFDDKVTDMLRDEYRIPQATRVRADTLEELVHKMEGVDPDRLLEILTEYNDRVDDTIPYDPNVKDASHRPPWGWPSRTGPPGSTLPPTRRSPSPVA